MKTMEALIKQINEFSSIAKKRELTQQEKTQRAEVREEYRKLFRQGFEQRLQSIKIVDEEEMEKK